MESKPRKIKVWYQATDICREVDRALIEALDAVGYDCGDVGSYIGNPDFIERDMEFVREGLDEYPEDEESYPEPGTVWFRCTLEDYEANEIFSMLDVSLEATKGTEWEKDIMPMLRDLKRKLEKGMRKPKGE